MITAFLCLPLVVFALAVLRFVLPMSWRIRWPRWDALLCRVGSHRCVSTCGCCWTCVRCDAAKKDQLPAHYAGARAALARRRGAR